MTGTLGIFILVFTCRLTPIINTLILEWGKTPPQIERIKTIRLFLFIMACTFLAINFTYNFIVPVLNIIQAVKEEKTGNYKEIISNFAYIQLVADIFEIMILFLNL